jgi:hypothetical protein
MTRKRADQVIDSNIDLDVIGEARFHVEQRLEEQNDSACEDVGGLARAGIAMYPATLVEETIRSRFMVREGRTFLLC